MADNGESGLRCASWQPCLHPKIQSNHYKESCNDANDAIYYQSVPSLAILASDQLVTLPEIINENSNWLPIGFMKALVTSSLSQRAEESLKCLLTVWPDRVLVVKNLLSPSWINPKLRFGDHKRYVKQVDLVGVHHTTSFVQKFIDGLRDRSLKSLRVIDLRGLPTVDLSIHYLATHVVLAYNESKKNQIVDLVEQMRAAGSLPEAMLESFGDLSRIELTLPDDSYAIVVDAVLNQTESFAELCKALKICSFGKISFQIIVNSIDIMNYGESEVSVLLELLNCTQLRGLGLSGNSFLNSGWAMVVPQLSKFVNLTALDLSRNNINFTADMALCDLTGATLGDLPNLTRLSLCDNPVGPRLRRLLTKCPTGLTYLGLAGCSVTQIDLMFLTNSKHAKTLQELDLSRNRLNDYIGTICTLLDSLAPTVISLAFRDCRLTDSCLSCLSQNLVKPTNLLFLDLTSNEFTSQAFQKFIFPLSFHRKLSGLRISYPVTCYQMPDFPGYMSKVDFDSEMSRIFESPEVFIFRREPVLVLLSDLVDDEEVMEVL